VRCPARGGPRARDTTLVGGHKQSVGDQASGLIQWTLKKSQLVCADDSLTAEYAQQRGHATDLRKKRNPPVIFDSSMSGFTSLRTHHRHATPRKSRAFSHPGKTGASAYTLGPVEGHEARSRTNRTSAEGDVPRVDIREESSEKTADL